MRRPSEITREQVLCWRKRWEQSTAFHPGQRTPAVREAFYAREWLRELLPATGLSEGEQSDVLFANEQKCVELPDPWAATLETLAEVRAGTPPRPGWELAEALSARMGRKDDWRAILEHFIEMGYTPEYFESLLDRHREEPMKAYGPETGRHAALFEPLHAIHFPNAKIERVLAIYRTLWRKRHDAR